MHKKRISYILHLYPITHIVHIYSPWRPQFLSFVFDSILVLLVEFDEESIGVGFKVQKKFLDAVFFDRTVGPCQGLNLSIYLSGAKPKGRNLTPPVT